MSKSLINIGDKVRYRDEPDTLWVIEIYTKHEAASVSSGDGPAWSCLLDDLTKVEE